MLAKHARTFAAALTLLGGAILGIGALLATPSAATARSDSETEQWRREQEDILMVGSWESALTNGGSTKGSVMLYFNRDKSFVVYMWVLDPATGRYVSAQSKKGRWQLEVHSRRTSILHVTIDGGQPTREYLEVFGAKQIGLSTFPLSDNKRILFVNRN